MVCAAGSLCLLEVIFANCKCRPRIIYLLRTSFVGVVVQTDSFVIRVDVKIIFLQTDLLHVRIAARRKI